ncbi:MAG: hypothetical protein Faunusvirus17_3 [Faunusvirus sp.]|jgi:hypothetical protein|uniref:Uncharacterized protein n=1 Tax=Faunusvirus sp. TaxID=2487766 RepID=A0A3G4ZYT7_9VIRU|nr:MAG: hypothetical protein Faunusvirus17_3 [Faunusvirus sp.]
MSKISAGDLLNGIFNPDTYYNVPSPVKDAWNSFIIFENKQFFTQERILQQYSKLAVRDLYREQLNFYKLTKGIIEQFFPAGILRAMRRDTKMGGEFTDQFKKMTNILDIKIQNAEKNISK